MSERRGFIAGGNWIVDHVKVIDAWPPQDTLANIVSQSKGNGGAPYNILINLAKLDPLIPLEAVGLVGDDADGRHIVGDCRTHGIDTSQLKMTAFAPTSFTDVMTVRADGRRTFFHNRGANALLAPENFDFSASNARHFHLGYALLLDALDQTGGNGVPRMADVLARARSAGLTTSLDCVSEHSERFNSVVVPVLSEVDVLFVNDFEAEKLTGISLRCAERITRASVEKAGQHLLSLGVRQQVIIHFPEGAHSCMRDGRGYWCASLKIPPESIAGAAGAGDAFAAGTLLGLHERWPMERCLALGVCTAAASMTAVTCSAGVRSFKECLELANHWGYHEIAA